MKKLKKYLHLYLLFRKIGFMKLMSYRRDFLFWMVVSLTWTGFNFFFYSLFFGIQPNIGGWNRDEFFLFLGVFTIIDGFLWGYMYQNMRAYVWNIFSGGLTLWLTKPVDTQFVQMTHLSSDNNLPRILIGVAVVVRQAQVLGQEFSFDKLVLFIFALLTSIICIYSLWFLTATMAFYLEKAELLNTFFPEFRQAWQVPGSIFTGTIGLLLHTVLPLALLTTTPANILRGQSHAWLVGYLAIYTLGIFWIARKFFLYSLRRYLAPMG